MSGLDLQGPWQPSHSHGHRGPSSAGSNLPVSFLTLHGRLLNSCLGIYCRAVMHIHFWLLSYT